MSAVVLNNLIFYIRVLSTEISGIPLVGREFILDDADDTSSEKTYIINIPQSEGTYAYRIDRTVYRFQIYYDEKGHHNSTCINRSFIDYFHIHKETPIQLSPKVKVQNSSYQNISHFSEDQKDINQKVQSRLEVKSHDGLLRRNRSSQTYYPLVYETDVKVKFVITRKLRKKADPQNACRIILKISTDFYYFSILYEDWKCVDASCQNLWTYKIDNRCYFLSYEVNLSWEKSEQLCQSSGGHLLSINSYEEYLSTIDLTRTCRQLGVSFISQYITEGPQSRKYFDDGPMRDLWDSSFIFIGLQNLRKGKIKVI